LRQRIVALERAGGRQVSAAWAKALVVVLAAFALALNIQFFLLFLHPFLVIQF
jgi:hypothetical protein